MGWLELESLILNNMFKTLRHSLISVACILIVFIVGFLLWHSMHKTDKAVRIAAVIREIKKRPEYSDVYATSNLQLPHFQLKGKVKNKADFMSLTNLLCSVAPDLPIDVWISCPAGRGADQEPGENIATTVGRTYDDDGLSPASVFAISITLFMEVIIIVGFWHLWKILCVEQKPKRDMCVISSAPFLSLATVAVIWWNSPSKDSNWNPWVVLFAFLVTTALFSYCLYSAFKGRYRLLSFLGIFTSVLPMLLECGLFATTMARCFDF